MEIDHTVYKKLLESTKAIPWKIDWKTLTFSYIGPQIEALLGWSPESWVGAQDWADRMHPEDREETFNFCVSQSQAGVDHEADYRALTKDGRYVWIRDVVHVVRVNGEVESLVGFMFDITERKETEEKLRTLQKELEELSFKDGLTNIANRRLFDSIMDIEWSNARRNQQPLSLILIDIDYFKQYNDHYGHLRGDDALKRVAHTLDAAATRPRDLVGRYGGEEFVMLLPETDAVSAQKIAERCRTLITQLQIPHAGSQIGPWLTVSIGVGSVIPALNALIPDFIDAVDHMLYAAKHAGRDQVQCLPATPAADGTPRPPRTR